MSESPTFSRTARWWGEFALAEGERGLWRVGPLQMGIARVQGEWRVQRRTELDAVECHVEVPSGTTLTGDDLIVTRFSAGQTSGELRLVPRFADRAVVVYLDGPFYVTAGQEIVLYCSTPLWVRLEVGRERTVLEEFPTTRPSDTWFGNSTLRGELCYATTTAARRLREELVVRPHRAITELRIRNEADDALLIEKVNLSVAYLSLYAARDGGLWSDRVTLHRTRGGTGSELEIVTEPPAEVESAPVSSARLTPGKGNVVVRAFEALFT